MYLRLVLCAFLATACCKDIELGQNSTDARKIFDEKREASPAVWRQIERVTVNTTDEEIISRVVVTDLRPNKDGDANIVEGGDGNQTVTIELKSPTVLRGFEFHIEVYAVPNKGQHEGGLSPAIVGNEQGKDQSNSNGEGNLNGNIQPPTPFGATFSTKPPVPLSTDVKIDEGQRITRSPEDAKPADSAAKQPEMKKVPVDITKDAEADDNTPITSHKSGEVSTSTQRPVMKTNDHPRHARDTAKISQSTTVAPSTIQPAKYLKDAGGQPLNYPQWYVDKLVRDIHSTPVPTSTATTHKFSDYRTDKPRVERDTELKTPKAEQKPASVPSDKNIQKIPTSGHIPIPKELKDIQDGKLNQDGNAPAPYVPKEPVPSQAVHSKQGEKDSKDASKAVGVGASSESDEDDSSEKNKKPDSPHTVTAQKPKSV